MKHIRELLRNKKIRILLIIFSSYNLLLLLDGVNHTSGSFTFCVFKNITGYPCPGCGLGRATLDILHGHFLHSFQYNIIAIPLNVAVVVTVVWLIVDLICKQDTFFRSIKRKIPYIYILLLFVLVLVSWGLNIARGI